MVRRGLGQRVAKENATFCSKDSLRHNCFLECSFSEQVTLLENDFKLGDSRALRESQLTL